MSAEWKPGDVAMVLRRGATEAVVGLRDTYGWATNTLGHDRAHAHWTTASRVTPIRPLVVIDPEDREQVERLMREYRAAHYGPTERNVPIVREVTDSLQAALREFANPTPPKPDEPQGDGAVVVDAMGHRWVRIAGSAVDSPPWRHRGHGARWWGKITAVRVLSEGVTQ